MLCVFFISAITKVLCVLPILSTEPSLLKTKFCLSLAFNINSSETQDVFALSFEKVYFALSTDSVNYSLWRNLEIHTKSLSWLKDWDKCKKLVNALVDYFIKNGFPIKRFVLNIQSEQLKDRILTQYKKRKY